MSSGTLQFLVAGALIVAWAWMLGRPLLTTLLRRSRRDSVGHFRYQQAVLGQPVEDSPRTFRGFGGWSSPIATWRAQPIERQRLQVMLAFAIATFGSSLLAIALRGPFVRLFLLMALSFGVYLLFAAYIGSIQLREQQEQYATRFGQRQAAPQAVAGRSQHAAVIDHDTVHADIDVGGLLDESDLLVERVFDDSFFEPIPELQFEPLDIDPDPDDGRDLDFDIDAVPPMIASEGEWLDLEDDVHHKIDGEDVGDGPVATAGVFDERVDEPVEDAVVDEARPEPTFTAPPARTPSSKRPKARPIYIESLLDDEDEQQRVVND